jgi:hypothetical protein
MAQIELRNATIRLVDGYSNTAQVNDTPVNGMTTMLIDTLNTQEVVSPGTRFSIVGDDLRHYVTAENHDEVQRIVVDATSGNYTLGFTGTVASPISVQTTSNIAYHDTAANVRLALEDLAAIVPGDVVVTLITAGTWDIRFTQNYGGVNIGILVATDVDLAGGGDSVTPSTQNPGGSTRQITFTPAIATGDGIPADDAVITFNGHVLEVKVGEGNLTYDEKRTMEYTLDRGDLDTVREGDQVPMDVKFDIIWEFLSAPGVDPDDTPTIEDALKHRGPASNWVSSSSDACEPYALDIEIEYEPPCGNVEEEIIVLPDFRQESLAHDLRAATVAATGKCNATQAVDSRS